MQILVLPTAELAAGSAAHFVARTIREQRSAVLGLPTGRTMIPVYQALVDLHVHGRLDFKRVTSFNLDEFDGLDASHPGRYRTFMRRYLFAHVNIQSSRTHFPGVGRGVPASYDDKIMRAGGMDLCLLGIGTNGHLGFNEPRDRLVARTHRVRLMETTRKANAYLFGSASEVPRHAISMGIGTILNARAVVLLATGRGKSGIVRRALAGPITTRVPASLIQTHPNSLVVLDRAAAAGILRG